jgi:hypothetical protein
MDKINITCNQSINYRIYTLLKKKKTAKDKKTTKEKLKTISSPDLLAIDFNFAANDLPSPVEVTYTTFKRKRNELVTRWSGSCTSFS